MSSIHHHLEPLSLRLPPWRYLELHRRDPYAFLLDSARDPATLGRATFVGGDPSLVYRARRVKGAGPGAPARIEVERRHAPDGRPLATPAIERREAPLFEDLRAALEAHRVPREALAGTPVPLLAGAVGYFGYEVAHFTERLPDLGADDLGAPDVCLLFCDVVLAHCHVTGRSWLSVVGRGDTPPAARACADLRRDGILRRLEALEREDPPAWPGPPPGAVPPPLEVHAPFDRARYAAMVEAARARILAGDAFQVCTTHRLDAPFTGDPWVLYQELRRLNPAPFAAYLQLPSVQVVSSSPERFLRLGPDRVAESRPIKGTRPRGATPAEDLRLAAELAASVKDRAENAMIVDLLRNDLGRVSRFGSVRVPELMVVEPYATVFQLVSTIRGELREGLDALDLVAACAPGGSMTGAPKIEAMKIIDRLEPVKRGIYSGALGYLDFAGGADLSIVIRTLIVQGGRAYLGVGGAVVADSDPDAEYQETLDKARAPLEALRNVAGGPRP